jgi:hypothetical protein
VEGCGPDSSDSGQGSVMSPCENCNDLPGSIKYKYFLTSRAIIKFSRRTMLRGVDWLVG